MSKSPTFFCMKCCEELPYIECTKVSITEFTSHSRGVGALERPMKAFYLCPKCYKEYSNLVDKFMN